MGCWLMVSYEEYGLNGNGECTRGVGSGSVVVSAQELGLKVIDDGLMVVMNADGGVFERIMVKMVMVAMWGLIVAVLIIGVMFLRRLAVIVPRSTRFFSSKDSLDLASTIAELNKEMESVFGEPPPDGLANSGNRSCMAQDAHHNSHVILGSTNDKFAAQELSSISHHLGENTPGLSHVGSTGKAQMVDVSPKENSSRTAIASCKVVLGKKVFDLVLANQMAKGDVLTVAKIAGINGAKHTSTLIPLCHNITLAHVRVDLRLNSEDFSVEIEGEAASTGKTGVEMEAMTAVSIAGLTVYDMCKAASKDIQVTDIRLECKTGGKTGYWCREE